ncbi:DUF1559 family PulG-like putative transporter [Lacunimicrobium album]
MTTSSENPMQIAERTGFQELILYSRWAVTAIVLIAMMVFFGWGFFQLIYFVLFGWIEFLNDRWGRVQPDWSAVWLGLAAMILFSMGATVVTSRWLRNWGKGIRAATGVCLMMFSMFASGIGIIGIAHQMVWMSTIEAPFLIGGNEFTWKEMSKGNLRVWTNLGMHWRGHIVAPEVSHLSWESFLITGSSPYEYDLIDGSFSRNGTVIQTELPWDAEQNREFYSTQQKFFVNPGLFLLYPRGDFKYDERGYALNNYSANQLMMPEGKIFRRVHVADGESNTIYLGEIRDYFQPWGKPGNVRDVTLGVNQDPNGFGGPFEGGCHFSMVDGSVRFVNEAVDSRVLEALATPDGGETMPKEF